VAGFSIQSAEGRQIYEADLAANISERPKRPPQWRKLKQDQLAAFDAQQAGE
jgi:hypothetical protein